MTDNDISTSKKLSMAKSAYMTPFPTSGDNPWIPQEVDTMESDEFKTYKGVVAASRFFYKKDALSSTILNKMVEIGVNGFVLSQKKLSDNEFRVFTGMLPKLKIFAEQMALEYLKSGLIVPEINFTSVSTDELRYYNIKKYNTLTLPTMMWLRDPSTIIINTSMLGSEPSYYVEVPDKMIFFIQNGGKYPDGREDRNLYSMLVVNYPEFIIAVKNGEKAILLNNKLIVRRKAQSYESYPIPYLEPALEALKHKRNLRRMDYSIASRVISAILLFRLGSDEFPVTEEDDDTFEALKSQLLYRDATGKNVERIFQLFANHTLQIDWIMPDIAALIDDTKYKEINQEIMFALGFPRILITGETERSSSSEAEYAMLSPVKTMESFRDKVIEIIRFVVNETARLNKFVDAPDIAFAPLSLIAFKDFFESLRLLYESGNLSRTSFANILGTKWEDEMNKKENENKLLEEKGLEMNAPMPFSPQPDVPNAEKPQEPGDVDKEKPVKKEKNTKNISK